MVMNLTVLNDNVLSLKSWTSSEYYVPSGFSRLCMCPRCLPEGEVVVAYFQFLNPLLNYFNGITFSFSVDIISLFRFRLFRYLATVLEMSSFDKSAIPSSNLSEKLV